MADDPFSAQRLVAAAMYAPISLGARLVEEIPVGITKIRQHLAFARFVGKMAVDGGARELQRRLASPTREPDGMADTDGRDTAVESSDPTTDPGGDAALVVDHDAAPEEVTATAERLALPDYDQLPAAHIVGKLAGLTTAERNDIAEYEATHRHRRTVLGKLDQLEGG